MKTFLPTLLLFATAALAGAQDAAKKPAAWGQDESDLKPDPKITFGTLGNGLRYVILPNSEPPERTSLRLYVDAGSVMETEEQRGLAHFIEHMAFNGTTNYPEGKMVEYFQRLGMSFGGDTNAHTSFKETVYKLELPKPDEKMMREGLQLFRDYADGMLLTQDEIEKERGVILSEKLTRDSPEWRTTIAAFAFVLPDSIISTRLPIGTKEVIKGANRDTFVDFYKKWYSCDRMVLVAVGAVEPDKLAPLIEEYFSSMKRPEPTVADPDLGKITEGRGLITKIHFEKEASSTDISIETVQAWKHVADTSEQRLKALRLRTANWIIGRRLEKLAKQEGAPFLSGSAYEQSFLDFVRFGGMSITCKPETWEGALQVADQELRRALQFGFTAAEIDEATADTLSSYRDAAKGAETRLSRELADALVDEVASKAVSTNPAQDLAWAEAAIGQVTAENCLEELRQLWSNREDVQIFVGGNLTLPDGENKVAEAYKKSRAVKVEPPVEEQQKAFAYTAFGKPGEVAESKRHEDLGLTQIRFNNQVRLNLKPTDFEKDVIRIAMRIGSGSLTAPRDQPGLPMVASSVFDAGGLVAHSADELQRILAGKVVGSSFSVDEDAFVLGGRTNREDLLLECQLLCAFLTAPGYREESLRQFQQQLDTIYKQLAHSPNGVMANEVEKFLTCNDYRSGFPAQEELAKRSLEEVKAWLAEPLAKGYLEIGVVGDFDPDKVIAAVAATFGALPEREASKPPLADARVLHFPDAGTKTIAFDSEIPKGTSLVLWPTTDIWDIKRTRRLSVLGSVLGDRLRAKVREELGEAYSPYARNIPSQTYTGYGKMFSMVTVDPSQAEKIVDVVAGIGQDLNEKGIDSDELERAVLPLLSGIERQLRTNEYWLHTVALSSQESPQRLDWARDMLDDYKSITVDEVNALAKQYLAADKAVKLMVVPDQPEKGDK